MCQTKEWTLGIGIPDWGTLTTQVWVEQQTISTSWNLWRDFRQQIIRIDTHQGRRWLLGIKHLVAGPTEDIPTVVNRSTDNPVILVQSIRKCTSLRINLRCVSHNTDGTWCTNRYRGNTRLHSVNTQVWQRTVTGTVNEWRINIQAHHSSVFGNHALFHLVRFNCLWHLFLLDTSHFKCLLIPIQVEDVEHTCSRSNWDVHLVSTEQTVEQVFLNSQVVGRIVVNVRLFVLQPQHLWQWRHWVNWCTRLAVNLLAQTSWLQLFRVLNCTRVSPRDNTCQRLPISVKCDQWVHCWTEWHTQNLATVCAAHNFCHCVDEGFPNFV